MNIDRPAKIVWEYLKLNQPIKKSDCILVLGSHDVVPAHYGIELFKKGYGSHIAFSGGAIQEMPGHISSGKVEAEEYADIARKAGIPEEKIIVENASKNTGDNFTFTAKAIKERGLDFKSFLVIHKPYDERRDFAVASKLWPDKEVTVVSKPTTFEEYTSGLIAKEKILNNLTGILQRIKIYSDKGFQVPQEIPTEVWSAFEEMVAAGYDKRLVSPIKS
ncbi:MAG TPA: YdcF family protein [Candidatus Paceibacterota bacterium]